MQPYAGTSTLHYPWPHLPWPPPLVVSFPKTKGVKGGSPRPCDLPRVSLPEASGFHGIRAVSTCDNDVARRRAYEVVVLALLGPGLHADRPQRPAHPPAAEVITKVNFGCKRPPGF
jgi:hypothetical protein